jgi:hypothetical protein
MLNGWNAKHTLATVAMLLVFALVLVFILMRDGDDDKTPAASTTTPTTAATTATTAQPATKTPAAGPLVVAPGRVGAAQVGMSKSQAAATGLFNTDVDFGADDCRGVQPLQWKKAFGSVDVLTDDSGSITSMGVTQGGPETAKGIGVGSSLGEVMAAYPDLSSISEAGFDQAGAYLSSNSLWLGFLFDVKAIGITDESKVTFMEVTRGSKPDLIRDGC